MAGTSLFNLENTDNLLAVILFIAPTLTFLFRKPNAGTVFIASLAFIFCSLMCMHKDILLDITYFIQFIIENICIVLILTFFVIMKKRTPYGTEMLGRIQGFKNFLETAEKPKLEELVMNEPEYFYNILPYTYVLGISNKWMKKFEDIAIEAPDWYYGNTTFSIYSFNTFMHSTYSSISNSMSSSPSDSGGSGGGSGGGFSGGGSGGGGRWLLVKCILFNWKNLSLFELNLQIM